MLQGGVVQMLLTAQYDLPRPGGCHPAAISLPIAFCGVLDICCQCVLAKTSVSHRLHFGRFAFLLGELFPDIAFQLKG